MEKEALASRQAVLEQLVSLAMDPRSAAEALGRFGWDCETKLIEVVAGDAVRVLDKMSDGSLTLSEASRWAEVLDARDDV